MGSSAKDTGASADDTAGDGIMAGAPCDLDAFQPTCDGDVAINCGGIGVVVTDCAETVNPLCFMYESRAQCHAGSTTGDCDFGELAPCVSADGEWYALWCQSNQSGAVSNYHHVSHLRWWLYCSWNDC